MRQRTSAAFEVAPMRTTSAGHEVIGAADGDPGGRNTWGIARFARADVFLAAAAAYLIVAFAWSAAGRNDQGFGTIATGASAVACTVAVVFAIVAAQFDRARNDGW